MAKTECPCNLECYRDFHVCKCGPDCVCIGSDKNCLSPFNDMDAVTHIRLRQSFQPEYSQNHICIDCGSHWFYWFNKTLAYAGSPIPPFTHVVFCSKCGKPHPIQ